MFQLSDTNSSLSSSSGTPTAMSLNNSPEHTTKTIKEPVDLDVCPQGVNITPLELGYPKEGVAGIKQVMFSPKQEAEISPNPAVIYPRSDAYSNLIVKGVESMTPNAPHPIREDGNPRYPREAINPPRYPIRGEINPYFRYPIPGPGVQSQLYKPPGQPFMPQMMTVSMIESGIPRQPPVSPTHIRVPGYTDLMYQVNGPVDLKNQLNRPINGPIDLRNHVTGPIDLRNQVTGPIHLKSQVNIPIDLRNQVTRPVDLRNHGPIDLRNNSLIGTPMYRVENIVPIKEIRTFAQDFKMIPGQRTVKVDEPALRAERDRASEKKEAKTEKDIRGKFSCTVLM